MQAFMVLMMVVGSFAQTDSLFERATKAIRKIDPDTLLGDCVYDVNRTFVSEVKLENVCGGKTVRVCNARIVCRTGAGREIKPAGAPLAMGVTCLADAEGACPARVDLCVDGKGLETVLKGEAAITSAKSNRGLTTNAPAGAAR